ncbi:MAG TPA: glucosaminidase domain-containing protein [Steroidobacteraceae bacterium]|jgi:flagellar protein FlgJ|nr:glucosaminidase domain-containing protein [Steroidobacteraceae bacterium]
MNTTLPILASPSSPLDTSAAATYTDLNGLAALKNDPNSPQAISAVAQQVEALFLQMMLKSMRDAGASDNPDSNEMGMYQDMFDKQVALTISQHQDLGIGRLLKRQLSDQPKPASLKPASSAVAGPAAVMAQTPAEFVNRVMPTIRRAAGALGVNPLAMLAQAALESGWGQRMPRTAEGSPSLNLFGIKAGEEWTGARATADTVEFSNGVATPRRTAFRAYGSIEDSVDDFARLLKNSPRYREAVAAGADAQAYIRCIGQSGYATDPEYANKLNQILNSGTLQAALLPRTAAL